jgi:hypothetical protein
VLASSTRPLVPTPVLPNKKDKKKEKKEKTNPWNLYRGAIPRPKLGMVQTTT